MKAEGGNTASGNDNVNDNENQGCWSAFFFVSGGEKAVIWE
jgi:hypothetical protein